MSFLQLDSEAFEKCKFTINFSFLGPSEGLWLEFPSFSSPVPFPNTRSPVGFAESSPDFRQMSTGCPPNVFRISGGCQQMSEGCLRYVRRMPAECPADRPPDRRRIVRRTSGELPKNWKAGILDFGFELWCGGAAAAAKI